MAHMTDRERRQVLEGIARDDQVYPRDRIAAVRVLEDMAQRARVRRDELARRRLQERVTRQEALDRELDQILAEK